MVVNRALSSQPMCVSRLRNMVEPLYNNPQKDPSAAEALNSTKLPPPFKVAEVNRELKEDTPSASTNGTTNVVAVHSKATGNHVNQRLNNTCESGGWELVHEEPAVDIFMDEIPPVQSTDSKQSTTEHIKPNGILKHSTATTVDSESSPSADVRTYTPLTISSEEEGTASEPDSENNLEDSTIGLLRPKKKHAFNAPDLFRHTWKGSKKADTSDALSVSDYHINHYCII